MDTLITVQARPRDPQPPRIPKRPRLDSGKLGGLIVEIANQLITSNRLIRLFTRHFKDPVAVLCRFEQKVNSLGLPFDLFSKIREVEFSPQPCLPQGRPSFIYYFVPNTGFGTNVKVSSENCDSTFTCSADGIGLNMGCPVRLFYALEMLDQLSETDQKEPKDNLKSFTKHLSAVEELLWLRGWKAPAEVRRGGGICGSKKQIDWYLRANGCPVYLEAKYRPSDWAFFSENGTYKPAEGNLLKKAANQFPVKRCDDALRVVCITTPVTLTDMMLHDYGRELENLTHIDVIIFRSMTQMSHVISLQEEAVNQVLNLLVQPLLSDFPLNYFVSWHTAQRDERVKKRLVRKTTSKSQVDLKVCYKELKPILDCEIPPGPADAYRGEVLKWYEDGEPVLIQHPKEIWV